MSSTAAWGLLSGIGLGLGLWCLCSLIPALGRRRLAHRVAPYLVDVSDEARELVDRGRSSTSAAGVVLGPALVAARGVAARLLGGADHLAFRLRRADSRLTVDGFRLQQFAWMLAGLATGAALVAARAASAPVPAAVALATPILLALAGFVLRDRLLTRRVARRAARMADEFPTVIELLTMSLSAGEGMIDALRRVARTGSGALAAELGRAVADIGMGVPLATALRSTADVVGLRSFTRCVDAIMGALERGSPMADVLRAQASDARDASKRTLLEKAGTKELGMLLPVVFLILPVTVLFAVFPGLAVLQSGF
jgi:tight adherence protein C